MIKSKHVPPGGFGDGTEIHPPQQIKNRVHPNLKYIVVLLVNVLYCVVLLNHPGSEIYHIWERDVIQHYHTQISFDTKSYSDPPEGDMLRTIGYPTVLNFFMMFRNWIIWILLFNCLVATWLFYVTFQMIGRATWLLFFLGAYTVYIPILYTDLLFAALFVTSIWQAQRLWLHFLLLGLAALVRPSLAWFFMIEPFVLYYYHRRVMLWTAAVAFIVTAFNPIRNYINHGRFIHSNVMEYNMNSGQYYDGPTYFVKAFKANFLSGHYDFAGAMFNKYKRDFGDKQASRLMWLLNITCVLLNLMIWLRFAFKVYRKRVNWAYVLMIIYFAGPSLFGAAGARLRLPIEFMLL